MTTRESYQTINHKSSRNAIIGHDPGRQLENRLWTSGQSSISKGSRIDCSIIIQQFINELGVAVVAPVGLGSTLGGRRQWIVQSPRPSSHAWAELASSVASAMADEEDNRSRGDIHQY